MNIQTTIPPKIDFATIKRRQHAAWSSGDFAIIGTTLQIVGEELCEAVDLHAGQRVLDVAAGNGNATLAAARRFADVVSTDYVVALLERGYERAKAERLDVTFQEADAEALPFPGASFDVVLSTFGAMFTPSHEASAEELLRVCRPAGRIGLANWTPEGFIGKLFHVVGRFVPPPPGLVSPAQWGNEAHLQRLFGAKATVCATRKYFVFRYKSPQHFVDVFRAYYGPVLKAFEAIDVQKRPELEADLLDLLNRCNAAKDGTLVVPSEYLEAVITKKS